MLNLNLPRLPLILWASLSLALNLAAAPDSAGPDIDALRSALIPKREVGAEQFLAEHPTYDGRGVIIAVFDTGVDPAAAGLAVTSTGERKVLDMIDASGSGNVDTSTVAELSEDGTLDGLTGLTLTLPDDLTNPSGEFHLGMKYAHELLTGYALRRVQAQVDEAWAAELSMLQQAAEREVDEELEAALAKAAADRTREEQNLVALHDAKTALDEGYASAGPGLVYDCVLWHDGEHWRVIVDANRNGDLSDDVVLRPYGVAGEYGTFDEQSNATYGVQVYEDGNLLSIVTMSGSHGTHVASIAASNFPDDPARNGIAPGAQILSIKIGDMRVGGGSYGPSERRAIATAARYGVDIMNASWGGSSTYQNGGDSNSMHYHMLADRYDILAIMSAGNEGPGLSTAGSAGGEASRVVGVGAYGSTEMGKALYNTIKDSPDAALQFTSRGPTKDGDIGVDIMAPGAAWASISAETLESAGMYNGTSMAAPSASGVAALVLSAAKQNDMAPRPALMRNALMLGADPIEVEAGFTRGAGMAHAPGAWAKLQELAGEPAFDVFYDKDVSGGTFTDSGRGLYLRGPIDELRQRITAHVRPHWPESTDNDARFDFDQSLVLKPAADWIEAPEFMHMVNAEERIILHLNIPEMSALDRERGSLLMSRVDAFLPGKEELGAVFSVPLTIVRPADASVFDADHRLETKLTLSPAVTVRRFYEVPAHAETLRVRVKHLADDPVARRFFLQVITVAAEHGQHHYKGELVSWIDEGDEREMLVDVRGGGVTELAFNQYFYSPETAELELELEWLGVGLKPNAIALEPNHRFTPVEFTPLATGKVGVSAELTHGVQVYLPVTTEEFREDQRAERPASPRTAGPSIDPTLRLTYELSFDEDISAAFGGAQNYDFSEGYLGGRILAVHESGEVLYNGFPNPENLVDFPAGTTTVQIEHGTLIDGILDAAKTLPLRLLVPLDGSASLGVRAQERDIFHGSSTGSLSLHEGRQHLIFIEDQAVEAANELEPMPDYLIGDLTFMDGDDEISDAPLSYQIGYAPSAHTDLDPDPTPGDDLKTVIETFADSVHELQLAFVQEQRLNDELEIAEKRYALLDAMMAERSDDPAPYIERAIEGAILAGLASDFWGSLPEESEDDAEESEDSEESDEDEVERLTKDVPEEAAILAWLDEAEDRADPEGVAQFFGAKPEALPGDLETRDEIAAEEAEWSANRDALATITLLRADLHRAAGDIDAAWETLADLRRWEAEASDDTTALTAALYEEAGLSGLALEALNGQIADDPYSTDLIEQRIALYRELGWDRHAEADERLLAVRAANLDRLNTL